jgi:excisionase family DNA binding protein
MKIVTLTLDQLQEEPDIRFSQMLQALRHTLLPTTDAEYLTTKQALDFIHLSKPTLNKLRREGRITAYNSSDKRVLYKRSELTAYLEAAQQKGGKAVC